MQACLRGLRPARTAVVLLLAGATMSAAAPGEATGPAIMLDGAVGDWPDGTFAVADDQWLWLRLVTDEAFTLQGGVTTSVLELDLDGEATTGRRTGELGIDLEVLFGRPSPERGKGPSPGIEVRIVDDHGLVTPVGHAAVGLAFAPTYASREYELRLARRTTLPEPAGSRWHASRTVGARFRVTDAAGRTVQDGGIVSLDVPAAGATPAPHGTLPPRPAGTVRLVSWNVENAAPRQNPEPFARMLRALDPDVLCLQEWWRTSVPELEAWASAHLPSDPPWRAFTFGDLGVAVLSRLPARALLEEPLVPDREVDGRKARPIRFVAAAIDTPAGTLVAASTHLKARGAKGTWEDELRSVEAAAIRGFLSGAAGAAQTPCVVTGDMNLVGTRGPLDVLQDDGDVDGSDLEPVTAPVLGDRSLHTWRQDAVAFTPGRLDFALLADAALEAAQAFVADTALLAKTALTDAGLQRDDSRASDHLPLVLDLRGKTAPVELVTVTAAELLDLARAPGADAVLVNFWATWCVPCVQELPDLLRVREEFAARGLRVLLVSCDFPEDADQARRLLARKGVSFTTYLKGEKDDPFIPTIHPEWEGTLPATLVLAGPERKPRLHVGKATYEEFRDLVLDALQPKRDE